MLMFQVLRLFLPNEGRIGLLADDLESVAGEDGAKVGELLLLDLGFEG